MRTTSKLIIFIFTLLALAASAYAQSPQDQLNQMVQQLQKTPNDNALREKIIKIAKSIKPAPAIPEEANRAFVKGNVFQKEAKDASGYDLAIVAYREALRVAPWWGDAYYNLAVALEAAGKFDEAIVSIKLYMASVPGASAEAREAQNRVYAIEAKSEMASRQAMAQAAEEMAQAAEEMAQAAEEMAQAAAERERKRPSVEGKWTDGSTEFQITKSGEKLSLVLRTLFGGRHGSESVTSTVIEMNQQRVRFDATTSLNGHRPNSFDLSLSASGNELTGTLDNDARRQQQIRFTRMP
jgi:tetratricopeptide (TPR) repeat protein